MYFTPRNNPSRFGGRKLFILDKHESQRLSSRLTVVRGQTQLLSFRKIIRLLVRLRGIFQFIWMLTFQRAKHDDAKMKKEHFKLQFCTEERSSCTAMQSFVSLLILNRSKFH